jgi:hypothetical protein
MGQALMEDVHGWESVVEMVQLGGTDHLSGDDRLGQQPRQYHLRPGRRI